MLGFCEHAAGVLEALGCEYRNTEHVPCGAACCHAAIAVQQLQCSTNKPSKLLPWLSKRRSSWHFTTFISGRMQHMLLLQPLRASLLRIVLTPFYLTELGPLLFMYKPSNLARRYEGYYGTDPAFQEVREQVAGKKAHKSTSGTKGSSKAARVPPGSTGRQGRSPPAPARRLAAGPAAAAAPEGTAAEESVGLRDAEVAARAEALVAAEVMASEVLPPPAKQPRQRRKQQLQEKAAATDAAAAGLLVADRSAVVSGGTGARGESSSCPANTPAAAAASPWLQAAAASPSTCSDDEFEDSSNATAAEDQETDESDNDDLISPTVLLPWALDDPAEAVEAAVAKGLAAVNPGDLKFDQEELAGAWLPFMMRVDDLVEVGGGGSPITAMRRGGGGRGVSMEVFTEAQREKLATAELGTLLQVGSEAAGFEG